MVNLFGNEFVNGVLVGVGALALAQNLGDYRIDQEFLEYVFDPVKAFILHLFGKGAVTKIELKAKSALHDTFAKLDVLGRTAETDAKKVVDEVVKIAGEVKAAL
jgi:hypothetical protein